MSSQENASRLRRIVRIQAKPELADATRTALLELEQATQTESGCHEFRFFQSLSDEGSFILIEDFADAEALDHHMNLPHTQAFFTRNLTASITVIEPGWLS